jgi:hypothetical protein
MARESFLLRTDPRILNALRAWAEDDLRSVNGQLDYLLRKALKDAGRLPGKISDSQQSSPPKEFNGPASPGDAC